MTPEGEGMQDSTPIIERFEAEPAVAHARTMPTLAFVSALLEEYGDEWGNKWMFHYRWRYQPDVWSTAERIAQQMVGAQGTLAVAQARAAVAERMTRPAGVRRLQCRGPRPRSRPRSSARWRCSRRILQSRPYLLGGRPAMADFGLWGQFYEAATDPTPGAIMRASSPKVMAWVQRMLSPKAEGPFERVAGAGADADAAPQGGGRGPLPAMVGGQCGGHRGGREELRDDAGRCAWSQEPQKYHARSLAELRRKYAAAKNAPGLEAILGRAAAWHYLS